MVTIADVRSGLQSTIVQRRPNGPVEDIGPA
jgi:hypothetical protein